MSRTRNGITYYSNAEALALIDRALDESEIPSWELLVDSRVLTNPGLALLGIEDEIRMRTVFGIMPVAEEDFSRMEDFDWTGEDEP